MSCILLFPNQLFDKKYIEKLFSSPDIKSETESKLGRTLTSSQH